MKILLDTMVWLWIQTEPERLSASTVALLNSEEHDLAFSAASCWEIAIKYAVGRLPLPRPPSEFVPARLAEDGIATLPVQQRHALQIALLPAHHLDPFDRMLVVQAQMENMSLLTADRQLASYDVPIIPA